MAIIRNNTAITFVPWVGDTGTAPDATYWGAWSAATGGDFLIGGVLTGNPDALSDMDRYEFAMDALTVELEASGNLSEAGAKKCLRGLFDATVYLSLHSSNPGTDGANQITVISRKEVVSTIFELDS